MTVAPLQELGAAPWGESTNDISHYLGMLDPWYERNVLGLMHLPPEVLCQVSRPFPG